MRSPDFHLRLTPLGATADIVLRDICDVFEAGPRHALRARPARRSAQPVAAAKVQATATRAPARPRVVPHELARCARGAGKGILDLPGWEELEKEVLVAAVGGVARALAVGAARRLAAVLH